MNYPEVLKILESKRENSNPKKTIRLISTYYTSILKDYVDAFFYSNDINCSIVEGYANNVNISLMQADEKEIDIYFVVLAAEDIDPETDFKNISTNSDNNLTSKDKLDDLYKNLYDLRRRSSYSEIVILPYFGFEFPNTENSQYVLNYKKILNKKYLYDFFEKITTEKLGRVVNTDNILENQSVRNSFNLNSLYRTSWPYSLDATQSIAEALFSITIKKSSKKILITDLDNTFWGGVVGDVGIDGIKWEEDSASYKHSIYQKLLKKLSNQGVLIAYCSKNEFATVSKAFTNRNFIFNPNTFITGIASWDDKSENIKKILEMVNLLPDSAVFIDDSEFELAEVSRNHNNLTCIRFPGKNQEIYNFITQINEFFSTETVTDEDLARRENTRSAIVFNESIKLLKSDAQKSSSDKEIFFHALKMEIEFEKIYNPSYERPFQLINKTNQFNISGDKFDIQKYTEDFLKNSTVYGVTLSDSNTNHGLIGVFSFIQKEKNIFISNFVLSCRVFSRNVENAIIQFIYDNYPNCNIYIKKINTGKNHYSLKFIDSIQADNNNIFENYVLINKKLINNNKFYGNVFFKS
jgi:FkbH-like protein